LSWSCGSVLFAIAGITALFEWLRTPNTTSLLATRVVVLWLMGYAALTSGMPRAAANSRPRVAAHLLGATCVTFLVVVAARASLLSPTRAGWICTVLAAAFVEEVVFRVLLPRRLEHDLSTVLRPTRALPLAVAISQAVFAIAHVLPQSPAASGLGLLGLLRLAGGGLALWAVTTRIGLWLAASLHALTNLALIFAPSGWGAVIGPVEVGLWMVGGMCLASRACRMRTIGPLLRAIWPRLLLRRCAS